MKKNVEVVSLIFKSKQYLKFMVDQFKSGICEAEGWNVTYRIVANDATPEVIEALTKIDIPYSIFNNPDPNEYYLNRVYRAYNYCIESSNYDNVCLVNSDDTFSKDWLKNLLKHHNGINIPCSRLIESGKMASGLHGLNLGQNDFGRHPNNLKLQDWFDFAEKTKEDSIKPYGLFMPCIFEKERFLESGKYPEGNIFIDGVGTLTGRALHSGDKWYFSKLEAQYGMKHITAFDSLIYHIIEGEKDE